MKIFVYFSLPVSFNWRWDNPVNMQAQVSLQAVFAKQEANRLIREEKNKVAKLHEEISMSACGRTILPEFLKFISNADDHSGTMTYSQLSSLAQRHPLCMNLPGTPNFVSQLRETAHAAYGDKLEISNCFYRPGEGYRSGEDRPKGWEFNWFVKQ
jgi:hypothetical protein